MIQVKYLIAVVIANSLLFCTGGGKENNKKHALNNGSKLLFVEKWEGLNDDSPLGPNHVYQKRLFNNNNLEYYVEISKGACNVIDSVYFTYDGGNTLLEMVEYLPTDSLIGDCQTTFKESARIKFLYDGAGKFVRSDTFNGNSLQYTGYLQRSVNVRDSFHLIDRELAEIDFIVKQSIDSTVTTPHDTASPVKKKYTANFVPSLFLEYGLPYSTFFDSLIVYSKNGYLTSDEFYFKGYSVKREYNYKNDLIQAIDVSLEQKNIVTHFYEGFTYKPL